MAFPRCIQLLCVLCIPVVLVAACAQIANSVSVGRHDSRIKAALASGKAVLVAESTVFEPTVSSLDIVSVRGYLRPPITYWRNRSTGSQLVLGGSETSEGRGEKFSVADHYFIVEPGTYDLLGFVKKERGKSLYAFGKADKPIESSLGMVKFSASTLPDLYWYKKWVPPQPVGTTINGPVITTWYEPGHYEDRVGQRKTNAILVDMRGMITHNAEGVGNVAHFSLQPGQLAMIGDFTVEYSYGKCDVPHESARVCPLQSVWLRTAVEPHHEGLQGVMRQLGYSEDLSKQLQTALVEPGAWYINQKPRPDVSLSWYRMFFADSTVKEGSR